MEENEEKKARRALEQRLRAMQIEQQKRNLIKRFMSPEAYERLMNVRVANYEMYSQLLDLLIAMAQGNKITAKITDDQLKDILARLSYKPESKIEFRHK